MIVAAPLTTSVSMSAPPAIEAFDAVIGHRVVAGAAGQRIRATRRRIDRVGAAVPPVEHVARRCRRVRLTAALEPLASTFSKPVTLP